MRTLLNPSISHLHIPSLHFALHCQANWTLALILPRKNIWQSKPTAVTQSKVKFSLTLNKCYLLGVDIDIIPVQYTVTLLSWLALLGIMYFVLHRIRAFPQCSPTRLHMILQTQSFKSTSRFATAIYSLLDVTSKVLLFLSSSVVGIWVREMSVTLSPAPTTGSGWQGPMGAQNLAPLRCDRVVHTSPATPGGVLLVL